MPKSPLVIDRGEVRFDKVSFAYRKNTPVLSELSFSAPAEDHRARRPIGQRQDDRLQFAPAPLASFERNDHDRRSIDRRRLDGFLAQPDRAGEPGRIPVRGHDPGEPCRRHEELLEAAIIAAAQAAHADEFIRRLPDGYDTSVGELGGRLSGGQRQRISIARALLKDAPIILLDEPTSALDSETERIIQTALQSLTRGRTTIVIAHRLATVARADLIHVLDLGTVVESGTHAELLRGNGRYARLHRLIRACGGGLIGAAREQAVGDGHRCRSPLSPGCLEFAGQSIGGTRVVGSNFPVLIHGRSEWQSEICCGNSVGHVPLCGAAQAHVDDTIFCGVCLFCWRPGSLMLMVSFEWLRACPVARQQGNAYSP